MKKNLLKFISLLLLCAVFTSNAFATNVYIPQPKTVDLDAKNKKSEELQKALTEKIKVTATVFESKNVIQDINLLDTVKLGKALFTDDPSVKDDIEWVILDKNDKAATLLSKYVLDKVEYHEENNPVEYDGTKISKWMNKFHKEAFSDEEKSFITRVTMLTKSNIDKYFVYVDGTKKLALANYARGDKKVLDYWLRNEDISHTGWYFSLYANYFTCQLGEKFGVRPVITIKLATE